jgi:hypothetical protein
MNIEQITLYTHPTTKDRTVLAGLSNGHTYRIQDAGGDPCYNHVTGDTMEPSELNEHPALNQALSAVGEFYKHWLAGNEDPMGLLLRTNSPVLDELYTDAIYANGPTPAAEPVGAVPG